jgi:glycosyltransferase involved in cell wall biosynthesis
MDWRAACAAVIPCVNEQNAIGPLIGDVREHLPRVVVVDDGSSDDTGTIARAAGAVVIRNDKTLGKGAALQRGLGQVQQMGCRWALTLDGDGQHCPGDIPGFLKCAESTGASLIVGNRMGQTERMPRIRLWVNRWMSRRLSKLTNRSLPDSQCGFRLMNLEAWARLPIQASHFEIESEVLALFAGAGLAIEFTPVQVIYKQEHSKIHPLRDTFRWLKWYRRAKRRK